MASTTGKTKKESKYLNGTPIEQMLEDSKIELGNKTQVIEAIRILKRNWVDCCRDLRLLHKEKELRTLVRIPDKLLKWLASECGKKFADDLSPDLMMFLYSFDFDKNGIVYYIATDGLTKPWSNPGANNKIQVHLSSIMHDSQPGYAVLGHEVVRCVTKPEKNSWMIIDFTPKLIKPTHYTLRHYSTWDTEALRCWKFEASSDGGNTWKILSIHKNDSSLNKKGCTVTWKLSECAPKNNDLNLSQFYTHFRLLQTDFNSNRHYYLACSGFEIYGSTKDGDSSLPSASNNNNNLQSKKGSLTFLPSFDFDTNGIIHWLGTNRGATPWKNPGILGSVRIYQSSLAKDSHPSYAVVGRECVRCVTEPKKESWFMIDLLNIKVNPTHYSMRHYASFDTECVRNWRLDASNNSQNGFDGQWVTLMKHVNDTSINTKGGTKTWSIAKQNTSYSQFKIYQTGVNSNQHHYLPLSGFELYGTVTSGSSNNNNKQQPPPPPSSAFNNLNNNQKLIKPIGQTRLFKQEFDLDTNGLMYFLGIQGGVRRTYSNPAGIGMVSVTSSSLMSDSQPLSALVGRAATRCVTKPHQRSWMAINLKNIKIKLTHYTLRHYNSWDTEALRYWNLEGSNDGSSWIPIRQHMDDRSLRKAGMTHTWAVDTNQYYTYFRLYMTGRNSNNHWYLACTGLELYGTAFGGIVSQRAKYKLSSQQMLPPSSPQQIIQPGPVFPVPGPPPINNNNMLLSNGATPDSFNYVRDFDNNGVVHFLSTKCNTQQWQNACIIGALSIRSSGLMHDSVAIDAVVGRQVVRCVTRPLKQSWIVIDFHDYAICPTHYTLRHYASWDTEALRHWRFEGSLDGEVWVIIREHHADESLRFKGQSFTWQLPAKGHYYSMFRIFQFDKNSNKHYYLSLSGFEIYGKVLRQHRRLAWDEWPRNKSKHLQIDPLRNSVANSGSEDTWQTIKTKQALVFDSERNNEFTILIERAENTSNSWKFMVGVAPDEFTCNGSRQWLGSQGSWAYIGGTGGKCFNAGKSLSYGSVWGNKIGDVVTCKSSLKTKKMEFILNNKTQGQAFNNFEYKNPAGLHAAVSITATGSRIRLCERVTPKSKPPVNSLNLSQQFQNKVNVNPINPIIPQVSLVNGWNTDKSSANLAIFPDGITVTNKGSQDTWQGIVGKTVFSSGKHSFEIHIINEAKSSNTWKYIFGVVPAPSFDPKRTAWLGSQGSWGYIGGTGGKCHNVGKSVAYGKTFQQQDIVKCVVDFNRRTIEFFKNDKSQGVAFTDLNGPCSPAVSLTGKGSAVRIVNIK